MFPFIGARRESTCTIPADLRAAVVVGIDGVVCMGALRIRTECYFEEFAFNHHDGFFERRGRDTDLPNRYQPSSCALCEDKADAQRVTEQRTSVDNV